MKEGLALAKNAGFEGLDLNIGEAHQLAEEHSVDYVKDLWHAAGIKWVDGVLVLTGAGRIQIIMQV